MKKAGIYDPYLDTLGGGERYTLTMAGCLQKNGYQVDIFWDDQSIKKKIEERLGLKIDKFNFKSKKKFDGYDLIFFLSDGSIPFLSAKKNILHFQVPFHGVGGRSLLNRIKLRKITKIVCNSNFTKKFIDEEYGVNSVVLYPPVDVKSFRPLKKENIIISVGRFTDLLHNKRQDVLIKNFVNLINNWKLETRNWKLVIAGGDKEGKRYVSQLKEMSKGYPIEIITNPQFNQLKQLYGQAKIFWTAAGFGINEEKEPEKVEHFGITTVEAMAAGCVPVVIKKGGQPEIVKDEVNGLLWESKQELVEKTLDLIKNQEKLLSLAKKVQREADNFSQERFCQQLKEIVK